MSKSTKKYQAKPEDIVIDVKPPFCVEIIMASGEVEFPHNPERKNLQQFFKRDFTPIIIVEAFNLESTRLVEQRFRIRHPEIS